MVTLPDALSGQWEWPHDSESEDVVDKEIKDFLEQQRAQRYQRKVARAAGAAMSTLNDSAADK